MFQSYLKFLQCSLNMSLKFSKLNQTSEYNKNLDILLISSRVFIKNRNKSFKINNMKNHQKMIAKVTKIIFQLYFKLY